ncbi:MAG: glutathione S-transferase family protein [Phreatobacter sp.]|uniref:glutathione S-transferase family protein n=1 Tax=Phreatobacter sp. TaxID=1966341 RepID=UPI001A442EC1|nr:glutathione S-transferase family protein [Phreatobacter sp.]MBL8570157.1 glutathione S-transferase family protein [Phreatobacter sp.]
MNLTFYGHPFSSYCQKALIALYENDTPFDFRVLGLEDRAAGEELAALWPMKRFPVLVDGGRAVIESSIIIEHLALHHPGPVRLIPNDPKAALEVRFLDRFFDNYVMTPQQKLVFDVLRLETERDARGVADARAMLEAAYRWLENHMVDRQWAAGDAFTLADCAAAPALFYADWSHAIDDRFPLVKAYRARLNARPSFAKAIDGGRPYRHFFPLGAPDRD